MHVDAAAGAHVAKLRELRRGLHCFGTGEVARLGDFDVAGISGKHAYLHAGPFDKRGVVGEILAAAGGSAAMGVEQSGKGESLRRLHQPQRAAVDRAADEAFGIDASSRYR